MTGSYLIFGECMFGYGRMVVVAIGMLLFFWYNGYRYSICFRCVLSD